LRGVLPVCEIMIPSCRVLAAELDARLVDKKPSSV
jgi:hypothetical protein